MFIVVLIWLIAIWTELAELIRLPYSCGRCTHYSNKFHNFFTWTVKIWNSLPAQRFPLIYDLNDFRLKKHLLFLGYFWLAFLYNFDAFSSFSCNSMPSVQLSMEWKSIEQLMNLTRIFLNLPVKYKLQLIQILSTLNGTILNYLIIFPI